MAQLGDLLRESLRHAAQPLVTLGEELTFLDSFLEIESARFEGRLHVSVQAPDNLLPVMVPSFLLQPLVENAIRHGVGARLSGGRVEIAATGTPSALVVRVRDDGVGLPPGWSFERDAGVGLRNVAARLEHLYGRPGLLRVSSPASGGVEIQIDMPGLPAVAAIVVPHLRTIRALIVDDEKPGRERLRRLLTRDNRVELAACAGGGAEALDAIRAGARAGNPVQLMFLDVQMPELDGFGVLSALVHAAPAVAMPEVIFVTAHDEYALRAFDAHAIDYLLKPFSDERFQAALDRALRHVRAGHADALMSQMQALLDGSGLRQAGTAPSSSRASTRARPDRRSRIGSRAAAARRSDQLD